MQKRSGIKIICRVFLLGTMAFLMGGSTTAAMPENHGSDKKVRSMDSAYKTESPAIPPIDAVVPRDFQTASFGLG